VIAPYLRGFYALLYYVVLLLIVYPLSIVAFFRSAKYTRKSYNVYSNDSRILLETPIAFAITL
jgi:hypothetical protein